ncbi:MAG: outer membrane beta-barrel protein [Bacteroidota bacterium]
MKRTLLLLLILGCYGSSIAQQGFSIGLRFSPIFSFASITDDDGNTPVGLETSSKVGLSYGLNLHYGITDNYGFKSGVHIVNKGFKREQMIDAVMAVQDIRMTTVEIPLALKGRSNEVGNGLFINGQFGISADFRAGYRNEFSGVNPIPGGTGDSGTSKNTKFLNPLAFTFIFGVGGEKVIDRVGTINFGIIYHQGLTNVNNKDNFMNNENIKIRYISLDLGYFF